MAERPPAAKIGLVGLPQSGRTSIFSVLTGIDYNRATLQSAAGPYSAHVSVKDPRLVRLHENEGPKAKLTFVKLELCDTPPLDGGPREAELVGRLREMDGLVVVLGTYSGRNPKEDRAAIESRLFLADLDIIHKKLDTLKRQLAKPIPAAEKEEGERVLAVLQRLAETVADGNVKPILELPPEDVRKLRGFSFFAPKPLFFLENVAETDLRAGAVCGRLELDLVSLTDSERVEFLKEYGLESQADEWLPRRIYEAMNMITYFTAGPTEVAGWPVRRGANAVEGADRIHSDISKGFINAEITAWEEWLKNSSARPRIEGKHYLMQDGDIANFRFSR